jgi:hypothetical protein
MLCRCQSDRLDSRLYAVLHSPGKEGSDTVARDRLQINRRPTRNRGAEEREAKENLPFAQSGSWSQILLDETKKDVVTITVAGERVSADLANRTAARVAEALITAKAESLEEHSLGEIQSWRDSDEEKVAIVRRVLTTNGELPEQGASRIYAAHIVAAAVIEALANSADLPVVFNRMVSILAKLHARNPVWGPLFVRTPGDIARHLTYYPHRRILIEQDENVRDIRDSPPEGRD